MKKVLIAMLAVLLLLSFTSCEKDKSEEVIAALENFYKTGDCVFCAMGVVEIPDDETVNYEYTDATTDVSDAYLHAFLYNICGVKKEVASIESVSGKVTGAQKSGVSSDLTFSDVVVKYKLADDETVYEFTLSGTYKGSIEKKGETEIESREFSFTVNGTQYSWSYTMENEKYTAASANGTSVDVRLLNSRVSHWA